MHSIDLNLASRPFRNNTPLWLGFALAAALVIGFTAWNVTTFLDQRARIARLGDQLGGADATMREMSARETAARAGIKDLDVKNLAVQAARANQFLMRRGMSWTRLFNLLESVQPPEVKMVAVRPFATREARGSEPVAGVSDEVVPISLEGVAQDLDAFLEFERQLIQDPHFARVEPHRADRVRNSKEVSFDLQFLYDPEGRLDADAELKLPPVLAAQAETEEGNLPAAADEPAPAEVKP